MIRKAEIHELPKLKQLTELCAAAMIKKGIFQWNEHYPSIAKLSADIEKKELFVLEKKKEISGMMVITEEMDDEYIPVEWLSKNGLNIYVHRLATHPEIWGKGYGQELMHFAEDHARQNGFESVRLDTFSKNRRNQRFYELRGYQRLGNIYFPKQSDAPFYCYELLF